MPLEEEHVLELPLGELVPLVQLPLLHLPQRRLPRPHQLLLLLQELTVQQRHLGNKYLGGLKKYRVKQIQEEVTSSVSEADKEAV